MLAMVEASGYLSSVPWSEEGYEIVAAIWRALPDACAAWDAAWDDYVHFRGPHHWGRPLDSEITDRREHWEAARDACLISFRALLEAGELTAEARPWSNLRDTFAAIRRDAWPRLRLIGDSTRDLQVIDPGGKRLLVIFKREAAQSVGDTNEPLESQLSVPLASESSELLEPKPKSLQQQLVLKDVALAYPKGWQHVPTGHIMKKAGQLMKDAGIEVKEQPHRNTWERALGRRR
jgi:hypothetical protein